MKSIITFIIVFVTYCHVTESSNKGPSRKQNPVQMRKKTWQCENEKCLVVHDKKGVDPGPYDHLDGCKSVCGRYGSLWPKPTGEVSIDASLNAFRLKDVVIKFDLSHFSARTDELELYLSEGRVRFTQHLKKMAKISQDSEFPDPLPKRHEVLVKITVMERRSLNWSFRTRRESYMLHLNTTVRDNEPMDDLQIAINSPTFFGAIYALQTLSQLITYSHGHYYIPSKATIVDEPKFAHRGLLLDTSRNYYSIDAIKRILDGMMYNKLNVFHWHITDTQSFPFVSERVPEMATYGAYSQEETYYMDEVQELSVYARSRGILLLPELDAPAHAAYGFDWGPDKGINNLTTCQDKDWVRKDTNLLEFVPYSAEPPPGQLNPTNKEVYKVLGELYKDFVDSFGFQGDLPLFHMGGDEVNFDCWAKDPDIRKWLEDHEYDRDQDGYIHLWSYFQRKAHHRLLKAYEGNNMAMQGAILWTSELTMPEYLEKHFDPSKYIIQVWTEGTDKIIGELLYSGYRLIMSNTDAWYFDCGFEAWIWNGRGPDNNWCSPFKGWKTVYMNSPREMAESAGIEDSVARELILGGEAAMWSEQVDEQAVEGRLWPRGCALAERLWSDPKDKDAWKSAEPRILQQRYRMVKIMGIRADGIQPEFCRQNDGYCYAKPSRENQNQFDHNDQNVSNPGYTQQWQTGRTLDMPELKQWQLFGFSASIVILIIIVFLVIKRRFALRCLARIYRVIKRALNAIIFLVRKIRFIRIR